MSAPSTVVDNLDGSRTEYFAVDATEGTLLALTRELFEDHWEHVIFGPCIEGAVFEGCFSERPRLSLLDGYLTVEVEGGDNPRAKLAASIENLATSPAFGGMVARHIDVEYFAGHGFLAEASAWMTVTLLAAPDQ